MRVIYVGSVQLRTALATLAALGERGNDAFHINLTKDPSKIHVRKIYVEVRQGQQIPIKQMNVPYAERKGAIARKIMCI